MNPSAVALALFPLAFASSPLPAPLQDAPRSQPADPTAYDATLRRALAPPEAGRAPSPALLATPFPAVSIRGLVVPAGGSGLAILEVDGTRFQVRAGSTVPFGAGDSLRIESIGAGEILLARTSTGETRALR